MNFKTGYKVKKKIRGKNRTFALGVDLACMMEKLSSFSWWLVTKDLY